MNNSNIRNSRGLFKIIILLSFGAFLFSCSKAPAQAKKSAANSNSASVSVALDTAAFTVTFIELGSVNCIPCKAMQPIMEELRQTYPKQVNVIFHDVWTKEGEPLGKQFGIRVIPTQVFLDKDGKENFRHEGFFSMEELAGC